MRRHGDAYWSLLEVERHLRNALSIVRTAGRLVADSSSIRAEVSKIDDLLADAVALAAASKRRLLEEQFEPEATRPAA